MAKFAVLSLFGQNALPLAGARTQNCDRSTSYGIWDHTLKYQDHFFEFKNFYFSLHPTVYEVEKSKQLVV